MLLRYLLTGTIWIVWTLPFLPKLAQRRQEPVVRDPSARWGILLESASYAVVLSIADPVIAGWRIVGGVVLGLLGAVFTWSALRHLDEQWRVDAGLNADHKLVQTGPYGLVRNPIYSGMFLMLLASGSLISRWPALPAAAALFIIGTEIRVRSEEKLLRSRFGLDFEAYAVRVAAYVPFVM